MRKSNRAKDELTLDLFADLQGVTATAAIDVSPPLGLSIATDLSAAPTATPEVVEMSPVSWTVWDEPCETTTPAASMRQPIILDCTQYTPPSGNVERAEHNLAAIELAQKIRAESRPASLDERHKLLRYSGWGSLAKIFENGFRGSLNALGEKLESLLTESEFKAARAATPTAFYTPPELVRFVWSLVQRLGFQAGRVLDPCAGTGLFAAGMPQDLAENVDLTSVELDPTSALICKLTGADQDRVQVCGFEAAKLPVGYFDLVIGNVPFGNFTVPELRKVPFADWSIHNYFLGRSMEVVRPGGLVAVITSTSTMDSKSLGARMWLHSQAELLEAFRLPAGVFHRHSSTQVEADLLVFRRRPAPSFSGPVTAWAQELKNAPLDSVKAGVDVTRYVSTGQGSKLVDRDRKINPWFCAHPHRLLGVLNWRNGQYGESLILEAQEDSVAFQSRLDRILESVKPDQYLPISKAAVHREVVCDLIRTVAATENVRLGGYVLKGGVLYISQGDEWVDVDSLVTGKVRDRITGMLHLRDALQDVIATQLRTDDDRELEPAQVRLNSLYDRFVKEHGFVSSTANIRAFGGDPDMPRLLSLERYNPETEVAIKTDVFTRRTLNRQDLSARAENISDALLLSLAAHGEVVPTDMAVRLQWPMARVLDEMPKQGLAFEDPVTGRWATAGEYLSGHIARKLERAESAGQRFTLNAEALRQVLPKPLPPSAIKVRIGSPWIPTSMIEQFAAELMDIRPQQITVRYQSQGAVWSVNEFHSDHKKIAIEWGTSRRHFPVLLQDALNGQPPELFDTINDKRVLNKRDTLFAREKYEAIRNRFSVWAYEKHERAEKLVSLYNEQFNQIVARRYDGSHQTFPGLSNLRRPRQAQSNAIWRIVSGGNTLLAHPVGAGKSLIMHAAAMELKRLGRAHKILHVVPNHMLHQYSGEFLEHYPMANLLMATKEDLTGPKRKEFVARIQSGDWDSIVMTQSTFKMLAPSPDAVQGYIDAALLELSTALSCAHSSAKRGIKELEKRMKDFQSRLEKKVAHVHRDDSVYYDDLGVDFLFIDEAHQYKNLMRLSKMKSIAGLSNSNSQQAMDLYMKVRMLPSMTKGQDCGVVFATATPLANSLAEMHTMQRFLQPRMLDDLGLNEFDAWAATFGEAVTGMEMAPDGSGYRLNTRFSRFVNVPELMGIFGSVADIQSKANLGLAVPQIRGGKPEVIVAKACPELKAFTASLVERAAKLRGSDPKVDNMLKITGEGRLAALDIRTVCPGLPFTPDSKVGLAVTKLLEIYRVTQPQKGAQLVFCDIATPGSVRFSVYAEIKRLLIAHGVPEQEIAFAQDYKTDTAKGKLFALIRSGAVRFVMASTMLMGVGANVQERLAAVHQLDPPWRPCDVEQRDGRGVRVGNLFSEIRLIRYVTEGSFDAYMWQTLESKAQFIDQIMSGSSGLREVEDIGMQALTFAEIKAIASGNPLALEKATIEASLAKLAIKRDAFLNDQFRRNQSIKSDRQNLDWMSKKLPVLESSVSELRRLLQSSQHSMRPSGSLSDADDRRLPIEARIGHLIHAGHRLGSSIIASFGEFSVERLFNSIMVRHSKFGAKEAIKDVRVTHHTENGQLVLHTLKDWLDEPGRFKAKMARIQSNLASVDVSDLDEVFPHEDEVNNLRVRLSQIMTELDLDKDSVEAVSELAEATA